jgi:uncharacterized protein (DUF58 family)
MPTRHRTSLCHEGWYLLLLLVVVLTWALLRENNLLLLVAGLMCGMLLINWRMSVATLRRLQICRRIESGSHAGSWMRVQVEISNGHRRLGSWAVVVEDRVACSNAVPGDRPLRPKLMFSHVSAGQRARQTYRVCLPQRGPYALGPLRVSTRFPFGLFQRTVWLDSADELLVLPRLGRLQEAWWQRCQPTPQGTRGARRPGYVPGDFFALREWQAGDSARWVHWRSSARRRTLVVRQFEQPGERQLAVLLDLWEPEEPRADHRQRVELAVSFAATLVADCCHRRGPAVLALAAAQPVCLAGRATGAFAREAWTALALAQASPAAPLSALRDKVSRRIGPHVELVVISTRPNVGAEFPDLADAPRTILGPRRKHLLVLIDEAGSGWGKYFEVERRPAEVAS